MKRRILKLISLLLFLSVFVTNVKAETPFNKGDEAKIDNVGGTEPRCNDKGEECGEYFKKYGTDLGIKYGYWNNDTEFIGSTFGLIEYKANVNNTDYVSYCLDPNSNSSFEGYSVDRLLYTSKKGTGTSEIPAHDVGIIAIIANGANQYQNSSNINEYLATSLAIRAWTLGVYNLGLADENDFEFSKSLMSSYINLAINWIKEENADNLYKIIYEKPVAGKSVETFLQDRALRTYTSRLYDKKYIFNYAGTAGEHMVEEAHRLFKLAFEAARKLADDEDVQSLVKGQINVTQKSKTEDAILITLDIQDLPAEGSVKYTGINCPNCAANGITIQNVKYSSDNVSYENLTSDIDLSKKTNKNGQVFISFTATKTELLNCSVTNDFQVEFQINDPNKVNQYTGAVLKNSNAYHNQRFIVIQKANTDNTLIVKGNLKCLSTNSACETEISVPKCSNDPNDAQASIKAPDNIKSCIINNSDEAGNSYRLETQESISNNSYCSVFCKEDYSRIQYNPMIENINCGGWFKLSASIAGKKSCYTAGNGSNYAIDKNQFDSDISYYQSQLADALTKYNAFKALSNATRTSTEEDVKCNNTDCHKKLYTATLTIPAYNGYDSKLNVSTGQGSKVTLTTECSCSRLTDKNGNVQETCPTDCATLRDASGEFYGISITVDNYKTVAQTQMTYYANQIQEYNNRIDAAISSFNACTTGWDNEFKFAQRIKYEYSQNLASGSTFIYDQYQNDPYYNLIPEDQRYLDALNDLETTTTIQVCTGTTDNKYETCSTGWIDIQNGDYSRVLSNTSIRSCSISNGNITCNTMTPQISNAKFVRKIVDKKQSYETPTVMYQLDHTGFITTDGDYRGSNLSLAEIENGLAVSTRNVGGGITNLILYDLGEFYSGNKAGQSGRLINFDANGNLKNDTVAYAKSDVWNSGVWVGEVGEYYCMYKSTCRPSTPPCSSCDWECTPGTDPQNPGKCEYVECPECIYVCVNCLFNFDELQLNFKNISPNKFNNVDRNLGYNWVVDTRLATLQLLSKKANTTINEIEKANETIYDSTDKTNGNSNLAFSISMTPEVTNFIRDFNKQIDKDGSYNGVLMGKGYANDTLTCYDDKENGFQNIYCFSQFIDLLVEKYGSKGLITGLDKRTEINSRQENPNQKGYWTLWIPGNAGVEGGYTKPVCEETDENYPNCHVNYIGGPAWK